MKRGMRACLIGTLAAFVLVAGAIPARAGAPVAIYSFRGGNDGVSPSGTLVADPAGNLYGVTTDGGPSNFGVVFKLSRPVAPSTTWTEAVLYSFTNGADGHAPGGGLVRDSAGNLYGTTSLGGGIPNCGDCGTAFKLSPPAVGSGSWTFATIYHFRPVSGIEPFARMVLDGSGNLFGTTRLGGLHPGCCGVVFELSPPAPHHGSFWTETVLHIFSGGSDGALPQAGLTFDGAGNLYGTTFQGGLWESCCGVVFKLSPPVGGTGAWTETVLHAFSGPDGKFLQTDIAFDASGNIYGAAIGGAGNGSICSIGCGTAFELSPPVSGAGIWTEKTLFRFPGGTSGRYPGTVTYLDGRLYGPAQNVIAEQSQGLLFVLSPTNKKFWSEAVTAVTPSTGTFLEGLVTDPAVSGKTTFYGAAMEGGTTGSGAIFSWTP